MTIRELIDVLTKIEGIDPVFDVSAVLTAESPVGRLFVASSNYVSASDIVDLKESGCKVDDVADCWYVDLLLGDGK